jgi:hypothetical protein
MAYVMHLLQRRGSPKALAEEAFSRILPASAAIGVCAVVIWAGYRFSFGKTDILPFPIPAPEFFTGIRSVWKHDMAGHGSYLLGKISPTGFWYYFPVVLMAKTPLATIVAAFAALVLAARRRIAVAMPFAFVTGIVLFSLTSRINIGVRHILPVYLGLSVIAGISVASLLSEPKCHCDRRWRPASCRADHFGSAAAS